MNELSDIVPEYNYGQITTDNTVPNYNYGTNSTAEIDLEIGDFADVFLFLLEPCPFKIGYGGRGSGKTWHFAKALILLAVTEKKRILCCREYQSSIAESVHFELVNQINLMGLAAWFSITDHSITCIATGSEFFFKGLKLHINEIKSTGGIDIVWIEEGQATSRKSLTTLFPTVRKNGSEIWISYNPLNDNDPVHEDFVTNRIYPDYDEDGNRYCHVVKVNYYNNPWFKTNSPGLEKLRKVHLADPNGQDLYMHIWEGETLHVSDAMIFRGKWKVQEFEAPEGTRFFFGLDFGFANDPSCCVRVWIKGNDLMIDYAQYGDHVDILDLPGMIAGDDPLERWTNKAMWAGVPGANKWPIKADCSQPAVISYLAGTGLNVTGADKWPGSVEDGILHLRGFETIYIHPRCVRLIEEAMMYRFKVDPKTDQVLPIIVDKFNHGWDAVRYALDGYIQARGDLGTWRALAKG